MSTLLKAALMALGAGCVLLFAGGFPVWGAPELYRGGAMLILGVLLCLFSLRGALRLAEDNLARLLCGLFCSFMAGIGLVMLLRYGGKALDYAGQGGIMWFGFIGMGCIAMAGCMFLGIFGFFTKRLMTRQLWLAGAHAACFFVLLGAYLDFCGEERHMVRVKADGQEVLRSLPGASEGRELPFRLRVDEFAIEHYEGADNYSLMTFEHQTARWHRVGPVAVLGNELVFGDERWNKGKLQQAAGMPRAFLPVEQGRLILQDAPVVKEYRAKCHVMTTHRGREEARDEWLKVNEPLEVKGWQITLMSHEEAMGGTQRLVLQLRRAPGRFWTLTGMLGLILCTACWCWQTGVKTCGKEGTHA